MKTVAIIGRPNVGKSALFNRFLRRRQALVDATPGVTRDRLYGDIRWRGIPFQIIDTGGLGFDPSDSLNQGMFSQTVQAMEEADLVLFVCDGKAGLLPLDRQVASWLRKWNKPTLLAVNKIDTPKEIASAHEFSALGLGISYAISSLHGLGIGELLDAVVEPLKQVTHEPEALPTPDSELQTKPLKIAIIGRPNVGKSSLLNWILNEERVLVNETPGTTRDPVEAGVVIAGKPYSFVDTAGILSKRRLKTKLDAIARLKAMEVISKSDVCLGVLDATHGIVADDLKLLDQVITVGKPLCLLVNKWDLVKGSVDSKEVPQQIAARAPFLRFAPVLCTSAKTGHQVMKAITQARLVAEEAAQRMTSGQGRRFIEQLRQDSKAPPNIRHAVLIRFSQVGIAPPTFELLLRVRRDLRASDVGYLEKQLRRQLNLKATPIRIRLLTKRREK